MGIVERMGAAYDGALYHGTHLQNLRGILEHGLHAGRGFSPHRTKTRTMVFLTDSLPGAAMYSTASDANAFAVVLEVVGRRLELTPDYDDAATLIGVDLMELQHALRDRDIDWIPRLGDEIPEDLFDEIEGAISHLEDDGERPTPFSLSIHELGGRTLLYAQPYVMMSVDERGTRDAVEVYADDRDLGWQDGRPVLILQQYQTRNIDPEDINAVLIDQRAFADAGVAPPPGTERAYVLDYDVFLLDEDDPEASGFLERTLVRLSLAQARELFGGGHATARAPERVGREGVTEALRIFNGGKAKRGPAGPTTRRKQAAQRGALRKAKRVLRKPVQCLDAEGFIIVRGEEPETCRPPKPGSKAWDRIVEQVRDVLKKTDFALGTRLGSGSWGSAFTVKGRADLVVKITGDRTEAASVRTLLDAIAERKLSWRKLPALAVHHCVFGVLDDCDRPLPVYVVVQDRLPGPSPEDPDEIGFLNEHWEKVTDAWESPKQRAQMLRLADEVGPEFRGNIERVADTIAALQGVGIAWHDLHEGNVLYDEDGNWRIIDLGFSRSPDAYLPTATGA